MSTVSTITNKNPLNLELVSRFAKINGLSPKTTAVLKRYASASDNQKLSYRQISVEVGCHETYVASILNELTALGCIKRPAKGNIVLDWKRLSSKRPVVKIAAKAEKPAAVKTFNRVVAGRTGITSAVLPVSAAGEGLTSTIRAEVVKAMEDVFKQILAGLK